MMSAGAATSGYLNPDWNFDAVPYVALAHSLSIHDPVEVHRRTFDDLRAVVPEHAFSAITSASDYRKAIFANPSALASQRPLYLNKPGYIALIAALHGCGLNAARAARVVSVAAYLAIAGLLLVWLRSIRAEPSQIVTAALLICAPPFPEIASLITPDAAALLPIAAGGWLILIRGKHRAGLAVASTAILFRPDASIVVLLLAIWAARCAPGVRLPVKTFAATCVAVIIGTFVLQRAMGAVPLRTLLRHGFESRLYEAARMNERISWTGYLAAFVRGLSGATLYHPSTLPLHLAIAVTACGLLSQRGPSGRPARTWILLIWAYVPIHYILFPEPSDRFFAPAFLLAGMGILSFVSAPAKSSDT
jgi:hypothetical protein